MRNSTQPGEDDNVGEWGFPGLAMEDRRQLHRYVSTLEVKNTVMQMVALKAPGPDGIFPIFYQKFWWCIEESLTHIVLTTFAKGEFD